MTRDERLKAFKRDWLLPSLCDAEIESLVALAYSDGEAVGYQQALNECLGVIEELGWRR